MYERVIDSPSRCCRSRNSTVRTDLLQDICAAHGDSERFHETALAALPFPFLVDRFFLSSSSLVGPAAAAAAAQPTATLVLWQPMLPLCR